MQLTADLSEPLLELIREGQAPIDGVEVGPWFSLPQIRDYRQMLPGLPFYFHGGDVIDRVGLIPGAISRIAAYQRCTGSPWVSMHITLWLPGMVGLMLRREWRMPRPNTERAAARFIWQVRRLARSLPVPVLLENTEPLPFEGYDFEVQPGRITQVLEGAECGFVLDISHARVSAAALGLDPYDYLSALPLHRVRQLHVSGPRMRQGRLADVHESMQEPDYELLDFVLERAQPQVVTLEYIRTREALGEQLVRLRGLLDAFDHP